jgi:hypothetical protein
LLLQFVDLLRLLFVDVLLIFQFIF